MKKLVITILFILLIAILTAEVISFINIYRANQVLDGIGIIDIIP